MKGNSQRVRIAIEKAFKKENPGNFIFPIDFMRIGATAGLFLAVVIDLVGPENWRGQKWTPLSTRTLQEVLTWPEQTIERLLRRLKGLGLIETRTQRRTREVKINRDRVRDLAGPGTPLS